ncbi:MAG: magnesium transporter [Blastocatellia bacterium AA13]|nr:MAG: magnesium transporter [Blastocatellia bacterium AA13]
MNYSDQKLLTKSAMPVGYPLGIVRKLLHRGARSHLAKVFNKAHPADAARMLALLGATERQQVFSILLAECETAQVAAIVSELEIVDSIPLLQSVGAETTARLLSEMPADDATSLASRLPEPLAAEVLRLMEAAPAAEVRGLLEHEERTAGRIMTRNYFALEEDVTVAEAIAALQRRNEELEMVFYVYVIDKHDHLVGVVSLRKLLTTPPSNQLRKIFFTDVTTVSTNTPQEEVAKLVAQYNLLAVPVVDHEDKLVGIVTVDDVIDVLQEETTEDLLALAGVATEEHLSTKLSRSLRLRAPWLLINLGTAFLASYVISRFEGTIGQLTALAALMSIVAGMGGNAATQTLTIVIRGMALDELVSVPWIVLKEVVVGGANGLINGLVCAFVAGLFYKSFWLGVVLAAAMVINLVIAGTAGILIPVALKKLRIDPAVASTVFVTTCTDVGGFFSFLGIATLLMPLLRG